MGSEGHQHPAPLVSEQIRMAPPRCRHDRVTDWMAANGVDALVATRADLVTWLAGYSRYYGGLSAVVIGRDGERVLVVPRDEVAVAEQLSDADRVTGYGERGFGLELNPAPLLLGAVSGLGMVSSARRIGTAGEPTAGFAPPAGGDTVPADAALHQLSLVKDADELARIYHAYELCWVAQAAVADGVAAGATEIEIMTAAQSAAQVAHGSPIEFAADLLAGPNTAEVCGPIAIPGRTRAEPGKPVIADICVGADGYWADTCRTHVSGTNADVAGIYRQLDAILEAAAADLRSGATGAQVFGGMRDRILAIRPDGEFPHHGGHGVGLSVFDDPHVIPSDEQRLENWMVLALEPGIYLPGQFGVRRENLFLVTPDGGVELTRAASRPLDARALAGWTA
ncbi:MAG TPA: M24 family metallopeptidase [Streptosporangiaceae bacterium]